MLLPSVKVESILTHTIVVSHLLQGFEKVLSGSSKTNRFSCRASNVSFSLAHWARAQASCLLTKLKKSKLILAKQNLKAACPEGNLEVNFFQAQQQEKKNNCTSF